MSSNNSDTDREQLPIVKRKRKAYQHKFCANWLKLHEFKPWLQESKKGQTFYYGKFCHEDRSGGISAVRKHSNSQKHIQTMKSIKYVVPINQLIQNSRAVNLKFVSKEAAILQYL